MTDKNQSGWRTQKVLAIVMRAWPLIIIVRRR
jgi:hypothetical protein